MTPKRQGLIAYGYDGDVDMHVAYVNCDPLRLHSVTAASTVEAIADLCEQLAIALDQTSRLSQRLDVLLVERRMTSLIPSALDTSYTALAFGQCKSEAKESATEAWADLAVKLADRLLKIWSVVTFQPLPKAD